MSRRPRGFGALARVYDPLSWLFGAGAIRRSQSLLLRHVARETAGPALVVGGGTGGVVLDLLASGFSGAVVCLDTSRRMLDRARRRIDRTRPEDAGRVEFRTGDVLELGERSAYGLVVTHYVLDVFDDDQIARVTRILDRALRRDGTWSYVDFAAPAGGPLRRAAQRATLALLYRFFRLACGITADGLPAVGGRLVRLGWAPIARAAPARGWIEASLWRRR